MKNRENNYDLLRILSTIAVISIHSSTNSVIAFNSQNNSTLYLFIALLFNVMSRFAVPCFVMLSGSFDLANERNGNYKHFYKKIICNIGIPLFTFSMFFFLFNEAKTIRRILLFGQSVDSLWHPLKNLILGKPEGHLWYMYMMIFVWLLIPVLINLKKQIGEKKFCSLAWIMLIIGIICGPEKARLFNWDIGFSICFVGYLMVGYSIRTATLNNKNNLKGALIILGGIAIGFLVLFICIEQTLGKISTGLTNKSFLEPLTLPAMIFSLPIFTGFSYLDIKQNFGNLPKNTFVIYLIHLLPINYIEKLLNHFFGDELIWIKIPLLILSSFIFSWFFAIFYNKIHNTIENKFQISNQICKRLKIT